MVNRMDPRKRKIRRANLLGQSLLDRGEEEKKR